MSHLGQDWGADLWWNFKLEIEAAGEVILWAK
jgi:hypothetical protein